MVDITSPRAARLATPQWLDARFVLGVLLVVVSVLAGARVLSSAQSYQQVVVAAHPLTVGERVTASDFRVGRARLYGAGSEYVAAAAMPVGYVVVRPVGAGELVPAGALSRTGAVSDARQVSVPVTPGHFPAGLAAGDLVDVYETPHSTGGAAGPEAPATLVLSRASVAQVETSAASLGSGASTLGVVLSVPSGQVGALITALQQGAIDLVELPTAVALAPAGGGS